MSDSFYTSGEYFSRNPGLDMDVCLFKANNILKLLLNVPGDSIPFGSISKIAEIGCGSGLIIDSLSKSKKFPLEIEFYGYDICKQSIEVAKKLNSLVHFEHLDIFETNLRFDIIVCADVFEHISNVYSFLLNLSHYGLFFCFNIPLEISLLSLLRGSAPFKHSHQSVGHLHFYGGKLPLHILESCGYRILNYSFACNRFFTLKKTDSITRKIVSYMQYLVWKVSPLLSASLFGDSLIVIATVGHEE